MKATVEKHINLSGNFYKVYAFAPDKQIMECFAFDESKGWKEEDAKTKAIELADRISALEEKESVSEIYDTDHEKKVAYQDWASDKNDHEIGG